MAGLTERVVGLVEHSKPSAEIHPDRHGIEVVRCGWGEPVGADRRDQARIDLIKGVLTEGLEHLSCTGEPQHVERVNGVAEPQVDLVDLGAGLDEHLDRRVHRGVHLRLVAPDPKIG
jgi:hypothetical protein